MRSRGKEEVMRPDIWRKGQVVWTVDFTLKEAREKLWMVLAEGGMILMNDLKSHVDDRYWELACGQVTSARGS